MSVFDNPCLALLLFFGAATFGFGGWGAWVWLRNRIARDTAARIATEIQAEATFADLTAEFAFAQGDKPRTLEWRMRALEGHRLAGQIRAGYGVESGPGDNVADRIVRDLAGTPPCRPPRPKTEGPRTFPPEAAS
jgi:hypothetical protein